MGGLAGAKIQDGLLTAEDIGHPAAAGTHGGNQQALAKLAHTVVGIAIGPAGKAPGGAVIGGVGLIVLIVVGIHLYRGLKKLAGLRMPILLVVANPP